MKRVFLFLVVITMSVLMVVTFSLVGCKKESSAQATTEESSAQATTEESSEQTTAEETVAEETTAVEEPVVINYRTFRQDDEAIMAELTKRFHEQYPNITVNYELNKDQTMYYQTLKADIMTGNNLDVFDQQPNNDFVMLTQQGSLADLSDLPFNANYLDKVTSTVDGKCYSYTLGLTSEVCIYDKDVFNELGLVEPSSFDELIETVNTLKANGYGGIIYFGADANGWWLFQAFLVAIQEDATTIVQTGIDSGTVTDLSTVKAAYDDFKTLEAIYKNDLFYENAESMKYDQSMSLFAQKKSPLIYNGTWTIGPHETLYPGINIGIFEMPTLVTSDVATAFSSHMACVYANGKNVEASKTWVNWLADPNGGANYYAANALMIPTIKGVDMGDSEEAKMISAINYNVLPNPVLKNYDVWISAYNEAARLVLFGEKTADEAIAILKGQLEEMDLASRQ